MTHLKEIVKENPYYDRGQKAKFDLCVTRRVANLDVYSMFLVILSFIIETLEVIEHKLHLEKYQIWKEWDI